MIPSTSIHLSSTSYSNVTTPSVLGGLFGNLAKSWNVNMTSLIVIGVAFMVVVIIIISIIGYIINRKNENSKKTWIRRREQKIVLLDDDFDKYESEYGYIDMTIMYEKKRRSLKIQNLSVGNISNIGKDIPDCYIKTFMKNKDGKRIHVKKTRTMEDNLNPTFPEIITLSIEEIEEAVVYFQLFDENRNGNDQPMGDGNLVLSKFPQESYVGFYLATYVILSKPTETVGCGEVCVILSYSFPKLHINILEAKDLIFNYSTKVNKTGDRLPSVYAVVKVTVKGHKKKVFRTASVENSRNPYFFESFTIHINIRDLFLSVIKVELYEFFPGKIPKRIGRTCIGNQEYHVLVNDFGKKHLELTAKYLKMPHAMWHALIKG